MKDEYKIQTDNFRGEYIVVYSEITDKHDLREITLEVDFEKSFFNSIPFRKRKVIIYADDLLAWNFGRELTLQEYSRVLKRIFSHLQKAGFEVSIR